MSEQKPRGTNAQMGFLFDVLMSLMEPVERVFNAVFTRHPEKNPSDDPTYKANVERLIERNREFEK